MKQTFSCSTNLWLGWTVSRSSLLKLLDHDFCHEQNKTIVMISHDIGAMLQTAHRLVYLEETIWFDGPPANFPSLEELALARH